MPALEQSRSMVHRWSEPYPLSECPRCKPTGNFPPISVIPGLWVHDLVSSGLDKFVREQMRIGENHLMAARHLHQAIESQTG